MQTESNESKETDWELGIWKQIKKGALQGIDLYPYAERGYDSNRLKQIRCAKAANIDIEEYVEQGYDGEQLREIRVALKAGVSLKDYLQDGFCGAQLRQIRKGIRHFVSVALYADIQYNWMQMQEIRLGLEHRVDASLYANPLYSHAQMKEIRLGLEEGIDVTSYAKLLYSRTDMMERRKKLTEQYYAGGAQREEIIIKDDVTKIRIRLTKSRLEAYMTLPKNHRKLHLTVDYIEQILKQNGVVYGINRDVIAQALEEKLFEQEILVAKGKEPGKGEAGRYEFYFNTEPSRKPLELEDGRVDYQNVDIFEEVQENQVIVKYLPSECGESGMSVQGLVLPGRKGKELPVLQGQGFLLKEDGVTYIAAMAGIIEYREGEIQIYEELIIREDVGAAYGNIHFHGCIHIFGNVGTNVEIEAEGSISIEGNVEAARIISRGDVLIKNGMAGAGKGLIRAQGSIAGNFFEACELYAGKNVEAGYLMNSETHAANKVVIMGRKGSIIGGRTKGVYGIEVNNIGNRSQILTDVETGAGREVVEQMQKCQEEYEKLQSDLLMIANKMKQCTNEEKASIAYKRILYTQLNLKKQAERVRGERKRLQEILMAYSEIKVLTMAYAGTRLTMNQVTKTLDEDCKMPTFCLKEKEIISK